MHSGLEWGARLYQCYSKAVEERWIGLSQRHAFLSLLYSVRNPMKRQELFWKTRMTNVINCEMKKPVSVGWLWPWNKYLHWHLYNIVQAYNSPSIKTIELKPLMQPQLWFHLLIQCWLLYFSDPEPHQSTMWAWCLCSTIHAINGV